MYIYFFEKQSILFFEFLLLLLFRTKLLCLTFWSAVFVVAICWGVWWKLPKNSIWCCKVSMTFSFVLINLSVLTKFISLNAFWDDWVCNSFLFKLVSKFFNSVFYFLSLLFAKLSFFLISTIILSSLLLADAEGCNVKSISVFAESFLTLVQLFVWKLFTIFVFWFFYFSILLLLFSSKLLSDFVNFLIS